jgi:radical SAM superfamily enzyme YgiQ (UPF0313 family)
MAAAGVGLVAYGLESGSPHVLEGLGKGLSLSRLEKAIRDTRKQGMEVELFSQYGLPGERFDDAMQTLDFVKRSVPVQGNTNAQQMRLYFGTAFGDHPEEYGIRPLDRERPPYLAVGSRYETDWMSLDEIHRVRDRWKAASQDGGKRMVS